MVVSLEKTVLMSITARKNPFMFTFNRGDTVVTKADVHKHLGVAITDKLSWSRHVTNMRRVACRMLGLLCRDPHHTSEDLKITACKSVICPSVEYVCIVLDPNVQKDIGKLERIQHFVARLIFNGYNRHCSPSQMLRDRSRKYPAIR